LVSSSLSFSCLSSFLSAKTPPPAPEEQELVPQEDPDAHDLGEVLASHTARADEPEPLGVHYSTRDGRFVVFRFAAKTQVIDVS